MLDSCHFAWLTAVFSACTLGWGAALVKKLGLPNSGTIPLGVAAFGIGSHAVFFSFLVSPGLGKAAAFLWSATSVAMLIHQVRKADEKHPFRKTECWIPGILLILLTLSYLTFVLAGKEQPYNRFGTPLPFDDRLPFLFASRLWEGESPTPLLGDWLSSDRPPLQTAFELTLRVWHIRDRQLQNYHFLGTLLQCLWVPAIYLLCNTIGMKGRQVGVVLIALASTGFFLLNSVYVWPKLLAASMILTAISIILGSIKDDLANTNQAIAAAACAGLGFLAHGGAAFSIFALSALPAAWSFLRKVRIRGLFFAFLVFLILYLPWSFYQKYYDPPGNRLLKWHLAGQVAIDSRSLGQTITESYSSRGIGGAVTCQCHSETRVKLPV